MKRFVLAAIILTGFSAHSVGQPVVAFGANTSHPIDYTTNGTTVIKVPAAPAPTPAQIPGYGNINIALYAAPAGTVLTGSGGSPNGVPDLSGPWLIQTSPPLSNVRPIAGVVAATAVTLDVSLGAPGVDVELEAVYWTGNYATFADALASGNSLVAWSGSDASGGAFGWDQPTTAPPNGPALITFGNNAFNGLVNSIPEPSTLAVGGLAAAALLLFRRRK